MQRTMHLTNNIPVHNIISEQYQLLESYGISD